MCEPNKRQHPTLATEIPEKQGSESATISPPMSPIREDTDSVSPKSLEAAIADHHFPASPAFLTHALF